MGCDIEREMRRGKALKEGTPDFDAANGLSDNRTKNEGVRETFVTKRLI